MKIIATTSQSVSLPSIHLQAFLKEAGIEFVPRRRQSLPSLLQQNTADAVIVWQDRQGPILHYGGQILYFHPSMAKVRIAAYRKKSQNDPLIQAAGVWPGDAILDCTLGLGADSIVLAYFAHPGRVVALESSSAIACTVKWGMQMYRSGMDWLDQAIHQVEVQHEDHLTYLRQTPDKSFDIVYFDPMFRQPLLKSQPLTPIRELGNPAPLEPDAIHEAVRVARRRVVMKERSNSEEFDRLGFDRVLGSPHNAVHYGIIDIG